MSVIAAPIITEQSFSCSAQRLWQAITRPEEMRQWFFTTIPDFKPEEGFHTEFDVDAGERNFLHQWKIEAVIPGQMIRYRWAYGGYPGESFVTFQLEKKNDGCQLLVTHEGTDSFPQDIPEFRRESCQGGWEYFIRQQLAAYIAQP